MKYTVVNPQSRSCGGGRGKIEGLSVASARRLLFTARNVEGLRLMVTLTYPDNFPTDGRKVKRDLAAFRKWVQRRGDYGGLWWLEFQSRGAPHLHIYLTKGFLPKKEVSEAWYRIVGSQDEKHLKAGTQVAAIKKPHAVAAYAAKYCAKGDQKAVPDGYSEVGRMWGLFGGLKVETRWEVQGTVQEVAPVVRAIRQQERARIRESVGACRKRGTTKGFKAWGTSPDQRLSSIVRRQC